jgi:predicted membrane-bound mannosyltransferase
MPAAAGQVDATIDKVLDQAFAKTHELWMSQTQREDNAAGFLSEVTRLTFGAAASMQVQLAGGILAQRSAQAQPQQHPGPGGTG